MSDNIKRGCLMLYFDYEWWDEIVKKLVNESDVNSEGYEKNPHITIMYGFETDKFNPELADDLNKLKDICPPIDSFDDIYINEINTFENTPFGDVVKFNIQSEKLHELNKKINDNFSIVNDYPEYQPHMTIAYVKNGEGKKYNIRVNPNKKITPSHYVYQDSKRRMKFSFGDVLEDEQD